MYSKIAIGGVSNSFAEGLDIIFAIGLISNRHIRVHTRTHTSSVWADPFILWAFRPRLLHVQIVSCIWYIILICMYVHMCVSCIIISCECIPMTDLQIAQFPTVRQLINHYNSYVLRPPLSIITNRCVCI